MQTRSSDENSVCLSVCQTRGLLQNGRKICPDCYNIQKIIYPSFLRRRMVGGARPLLPEIVGQPSPVAAKSPIFNRYSLVASASAVTPCERSSINTNSKSTTRFPMNLRRSPYVAPKPQMGLKNAKRPFNFRVKCSSLEDSLLQSFFMWKLPATKL